MRTWTTAAVLVLAISQMASAGPIVVSDFINPTVIDFDDYSGFVGGPTYADPWLSEGARIWGSVSGGDIHTYPYSNNAVRALPPPRLPVRPGLSNRGRTRPPGP